MTTSTYRIAAAVALAAGLALTHVPDATARGKGGRIAAGIAAGVAGAIIINELSRTHRAPAYYGGTYVDRPRYSCRTLDRKCYQGHDWACYKLHREC